MASSVLRLAPGSLEIRRARPVLMLVFVCVLAWHRDVYVQNNQGGYEPDASVRQEKLNEIQTCYEYKFSKFSEGFYKDESWPHADAVSQLVEGDEVFLMLYKELYFRHLYAKMGPNITLEQRMESWENYTSLFDRIFSDDDDDNNLDRLDLPLPWLWDMVDEFVYQFTDFCRFRTKDLKKRSAAEVEAMAQNPKVCCRMLRGVALCCSAGHGAESQGVLQNFAVCCSGGHGTDPQGIYVYIYI